MRKRTTVRCTYCGEETLRRPGRDGDAMRGHFCDRSCYADWMSDNVRGEAHHNRQDVITSARSSMGRRTRQRVLERDGNRCRSCGRGDCRLEAHHIVPYNHADPNTHALDNLMTLCVPCHRKEHGR
jgi:hypothetical protein